MMANPINGSSVPKYVRTLAEILLWEKAAIRDRWYEFGDPALDDILTSAHGTVHRLSSNSAFDGVFGSRYRLPFTHLRRKAMSEHSINRRARVRHCRI